MPALAWYLAPCATLMTQSNTPMELNSTAIKPTSQRCHGVFTGASVIAGTKERTAVPQVITDRTGQSKVALPHIGRWPPPAWDRSRALNSTYQTRRAG